MPRITSQHTRQMLLVTGDPLVPGDVPEKLELFNEEGEPLMIGLQGIRAEFEHITPALASGASDPGLLSAFPGWRVIRLTTNRPARVRLYPSSAQRDADYGRAIGRKPEGNSGRLLEVVSYPGELEWDMNPTVDLAALDKEDPTFYTAVTNLDTVTGPVVTTYTYVRTE